MGSTTNLGLPYPEGSDVPDIPRDIAALANAIDAAQPKFEHCMIVRSTDGAAATAGWNHMRFDRVVVTDGAVFQKASTPRGGDGIKVLKDGFYIIEAQFAITTASRNEHIICNIDTYKADGSFWQVQANSHGQDTASLGLVAQNVVTTAGLYANCMIGTAWYSYSTGSKQRADSSSWPTYLRITHLGSMAWHTPTAPTDATAPLAGG